MHTKSPLQEAIENKDFARAKELITEGEIFPDGMQEFNKRTLLETLIKNKAFAVLDALAEAKSIEMDLYEYDKLEGSIFEMLFRNLPTDDESLQFLKTFIAKVDNANDEVSGKTLLSHAMDVQAAPEIVQTLINAGLDTSFLNNAEDNLIQQAARLNLIANEKQLAYIDLLIKAGADVAHTNVEKQNALHIAVERDKNHLLEKLIESGANPNDQDQKGNSSFFYALSYKMNGEVYSKLVAGGTPDFTQQNKEGATALSAFLRMMPGSEKDITLLEQLVDDGADLESAPPYYSNPKSGWDWIIEKPIPVMERLLKKTKQDVNMQDDNGNTLLHKVCAIDVNYSQEKAKEIYRKVKFLLETGADNTITNTEDKTPADIALTDNLKAKTVEILLINKK